MKTIRCLLCCHAWLNKIWFSEAGRGDSCFSADLAPCHAQKVSYIQCIPFWRQTLCLILFVFVCVCQQREHTHTSPHTRTHRLNSSRCCSSRDEPDVPAASISGGERWLCLSATAASLNLPTCRATEARGGRSRQGARTSLGSVNDEDGSNYLPVLKCN